MNQIMDHSGPKKARMQIQNPAETQKIVKVYAMILIVISIAFICKAAYSLTGNKKIQKGLEAYENSEPVITLNADQDIITINVSANKAIEEISYQWYRGTASVEDIKQIMNNVNEDEEEENNDDEEVSEENQKIVKLGNAITEKGTGQNSMIVSNIGIPKGSSTLYISIKVLGNSTPSEYIQYYQTDVGVDKIAPVINVKLQGKKLVVTAKDETKIDYITYSINDGNEQKVSKVESDEKTIIAEIELDENEQEELIKICAVDAAKNSAIYSKPYSVYVGVPKITLSAEDDYSKIYAKITYPKGIKKIEYSVNGETKTKEFDNPAEHKEETIEIPTVEGDNQIDVKAYADEEEVYGEASGECSYNPR